jgi:cholesterol transport system auxiliary component
MTNGGTRSMAASINRAVAPLAAVLLLGGCISFGGKVPDELIALTPATTAPAGAAAEGRMTDALVVLDPDTDRRLDVLRVPVQVDDSTVAYVKKSTWVERPARQFRRLLAETIRARGGKLVAEGDDAELQGKSRLGGRLLDMGYDARSQSVVVRFDALRESADGAVRTRRFEAVVPGVSPDGKSIGPALNKAANDVAAQVADWVG